MPASSTVPGRPWTWGFLWSPGHGPRLRIAKGVQVTAFHVTTAVALKREVVQYIAAPARLVRRESPGNDHNLNLLHRQLYLRRPAPRQRRAPAPMLARALTRQPARRGHPTGRGASEESGPKRREDVHRIGPLNASRWEKEPRRVTRRPGCVGGKEAGQAGRRRRDRELRFPAALRAPGPRRRSSIPKRGIRREMS